MHIHKFFALFLAFFLIGLRPDVANADRTVIILDKDEIIERVEGSLSVSGEVVDVAKDRITIESDSGDRVRVDVDDVRFPGGLKSVVKEGMRVCAVGKKKGVALFAHRVTLLESGRTYTADIDVDVKIKRKGKDDIDLRIKN